MSEYKKEGKPREESVCEPRKAQVRGELVKADFKESSMSPMKP